MAWEPEETDDSPDLTPMIDVVFLLIVFFMTVATLLTAEKIEIEMPVADKSKVPEDAGRREVISILPDGSIFAGIRRLSGPEELGPIIRNGIETVRGYKVNLRVDANTPHKHVREVMEVCAENGAYDVIFSVYEA